MSYLNAVILFFGIVGVGANSYANDHTMMHHNHQQAPTEKKALRLDLIPNRALISEKTSIKFRLINNDKPLTLKELKTVHTKKIHLLAIDESLSDYHHIHPLPSNKPGEFIFDFTPKKPANYHVWADVTPTATNQKEYAMATIKVRPQEKSFINKTVKMHSIVEGYAFTLKLDGEAQAGHAIMGSITVNRDQKPFTQLEPVMGAFAHLVGFGEDFNSVLHAHPMGKEPTKDTDRGGPKLEFHIEPKTSGFVKLFAQVRINEKDIFVPFGIMVK